ncbi:MAG: phytanoyl-CoA dioxygenase family protein, partial [Planctomycetaceae bacterium]|nr:phytanoyl-CoA dioxygenase family protein [Planctomycetaceae bacterium]
MRRTLARHRHESFNGEAKAGDVVAFSSLTLHATSANRTDRPRRVYLAQYT